MQMSLKPQPRWTLIDMEKSPEKLKWLDGWQHYFETPSLTTDFSELKKRGESNTIE